MAKWAKRPQGEQSEDKAREHSSRERFGECKRYAPLIFIFYICLFFATSRTTPTAYGGSQARGLIGAVDACLHHSHSNMESKLRL